MSRVAACFALVAITTAFVAGAGKSDVADAVQRGDRAAVQKLILQKVDVNAPQVDGATALHWAVYRLDSELADMLIRAGANVRSANRAGMTPLAMASLYGNAALIDRLIKAGADANQKGPNGETMLMLAARNGNPQAVQVLLEAGAEVNARETIRGTTALMWAIEQKHPEAVKVLLAGGADHSAKSGGAGLPRNYMANRVNLRAVELAQDRRKRAAAAGITYDEQLAIDQKSGREVGGQRGLAQALGPDGQPLAQPGRQGGAGAPAAAATPPPTQTPPPAATPPAAPSPTAEPGGRQPGPLGRGRAGGGAGTPAAQARSGGAPQAAQDPDDDDNEVVIAGLVGSGGGGLTPLVFAAREGDLESAKLLLDAGAPINQVTEYGWTPLLTAVNNRNYQLAKYLLEKGADPNIANKGGWTPLYLATDNRNIEGGDYPVPKGDMDHLDIITLLLEKGADPNKKVKDNTLTRTIFTMQWFFEDGATPFIRAAQSSDTVLMKLLLQYKADPQAVTTLGDNALTVSGGIGWVEGVTYERSHKENFEAMKMLLDLGLDPNHANNEGRTALMGAAMKGRPEVIQLLVDRGAKLDAHDKGNRDTDKVSSAAAGKTWQAVDYAEGLVRVGVQSAVVRPEAAALIRKLMAERNMPAPPIDRTILSVCVVAICQGTSQ
ncbi:MAG TPA: ankyrin repeat domain-containing protein [Vicinamibacterales bacterium]|nr:ankyrin repeat domain-containing protein [Vicinamibacterales bacterium]